MNETTAVDDLTTAGRNKEEEVDWKLYNEYITYNAHLDKLRSQNLLNVVPHLITDEGRKLYESI